MLRIVIVVVWLIMYQYGHVDAVCVRMGRFRKVGQKWAENGLCCTCTPFHIVTCDLQTSTCLSSAQGEFAPNVPLLITNGDEEEEEEEEVVRLTCLESEVEIWVSTDLHQSGHLIDPQDLSLGPVGCPPTGRDEDWIHFVYPLHACGSSAQVTAEELIYSNTLHYHSSSPDVIVRTNPSQLPVKCIYPRRVSVSGQGLQPTWSPRVSSQSARGTLAFSLRLLADDWTTERTSNVYSLHDSVYLEASVSGQVGTGLRLFVDECVATPTADEHSPVRYPFIDGHGCFTDGKMKGSLSDFSIPRDDNSTLQILLDAFRFQNMDTSTVFIRCRLKAVPVISPVSGINKACTYDQSTSRWLSVDGHDEVCDCCHSGCAAVRRERASSGQDTSEMRSLLLGPLVIRKPVAASEAISSGTTHQYPKCAFSGWAWLTASVIAITMATTLLCSVLLFHYREHGPNTVQISRAVE